MTRPEAHCSLPVSAETSAPASHPHDGQNSTSASAESRDEINQSVLEKVLVIQELN